MPPYPQRLPIVGDDDGVWGNILRQYLEKEHYQSAGDTDDPANGGHQFVTIRPGTTSAAPLTLSSGPLRATPAIGSIEFYEDKLYFTKTTGPTRQTVATYDTAGAAGDLYYRDSNANFVRLPIGDTGDVLTVSSNLPSWQPAQATDTFSDADFTLQNDATPTKQLQFDLDAITPGQTRTLTMPDADMTLVGEDTAQTLTNKTINGLDNTLTNIAQSSVTDLENDLDGKQAKVITGTSATGNTTAEKVVTAASNPAAGDLLAVTYSNGVNVNYPTLTVNGAATADVLCGGYAATSGMTTAVPGATILYWFDGTSYHMMGASSNTQYGEISETEIDEGTSATGRTITGRRTEYLMAHEATKTRTLTGKTIDGRDNTITNLGIEAVDFVVDEDDMASNSSTQVPTQQSVKAYVDSGLAGKANTSHDHSAANITSGTLDAARMPSGYRAIHVGTSPPDDTSAIWIDTSA